MPSTWTQKATGSGDFVSSYTVAVSIPSGKHAVCCIFGQFDGDFFTVTDSSGNTWQTDLDHVDNNSQHINQAVCSAFLTSGITSITVHHWTNAGHTTSDTNGGSGVIVFEVAGLATSGWFDQAGSDNTATFTTTPSASTSSPTTNPADAVIGFFARSTNPSVVTPGTGFSLLTGSSAVSLSSRFAIVEQTDVSSTGTQTASMTWDAENGDAIVIAYKLAGGGGTTTLACSAIPSSEAWGSPTARRLARALAAATAEAFGTPTARRVARAAGIPASEAWTAPTLRRILRTPAATSSELWGTSTLRRLARAAAIGTGELLGTPTLRRVIIERTFPASEQWGKPLVQGGIYPSIVTIACTAIAAAELWATPSVRRIMRAQQVASAEQFGVALLRRVARANATTSSEAWATPTLQRVMRAAAAAAAEQWGAPTVRRSVTAVNITTGEAWGIVLVEGGTVIVTPFQPGQILLADLAHMDVFVADRETWAVGVADLAHLNIDTADRPGG